MTTSTPGLHSIAWLSSGRLFVKPLDGDTREIESTFARESLERRQRSQQLNGWKNRSGVWGLMGFAPPSMDQWDDDAPAHRRLIRFCALSRGQKPDELYYVLDCGPVGGLFQFDLERGYEIRLMHREGFVTGDISRHPVSGDVAVSLRRSDGTVGITVGENDGRYLQDVTFSDGVDEAPAWLPDGSRRIVFHSAAWLRDAHGIARAKSAFRIEMLDIEAKSVTTVLEDEQHDLLQPRMLADGTLFFVRRPKGKEGQRRSFWEDLVEVLLIPWRLFLAIMGFLNFFSTMFTGKPLTTAGGPQRKSPATPTLMLWGQMIDTQKLIKAQRDAASVQLVPKEWRLIRRDSGGTETVLAENVVSYDLLPSGDVIYTDGSSIQHVTAAGTRTQLAKDALIERVAALPRTTEPEAN